MDEKRNATVRCMLCGTLNRVDLAKVDQQPKCGSCKQPMLLDRPMPVTDQDFQQIIGDAEVPVIVDFYADWCGPCKMMAPVFDDFARAHMGEALVAKLDTDRNQVTARRYDVRGIPTLIVFRDGKEAARQVGAVPRATLEQLLTR